MEIGMWIIISRCFDNTKMFAKIIVLASVILCLISGEDDDPSFKKCLTGYMTDVQSWVHANGSLTKTVTSPNAVDLSNKQNALPALLYHLSRTRNRHHSVKYLSMASCGLQEIPQIFDWTDSYNNVLSETVEYVSFYGNNFDVLISTGQQYDVTMNATRSVEVMANHVMQRIRRSWTSGFIGVTFINLKELDLRACAISIVEDRVFLNMPALESLYLGENGINHIQANAFVGLRQLVHLDISRNFAYDTNSAQKALILESADSFIGLGNLLSLDFSYTKLTQRNSVALRSLSPKIQRLSLCYCSLGRLRDDALMETNLQYLDLTGNPEILFQPKALRGLEDTLKILYVEEVALKTMEPFKKFNKLEILKLANNEISALPKHIVDTLTNLQVLDLDSNRITTWFDRHISLMPNLRFLSLRHNNINMITDEMATDLANVSYVGLSENFIICNCNARDLYELGWRNEKRVPDRFLNEINSSPAGSDKRGHFHLGFQDYNRLIEHRTPVTRVCDKKNKCDKELDIKFDGKMLFFDYNSKDYECLLVNERTSTSFQNFPTCGEERLAGDPNDLVQATWSRFLLFIIPVILLPALAILFLFRRNLRYCLITMRNSATLSLINKTDHQNDTTIFNYDVFVSYCNEDRAWVLDQLLPHVERDCNISVCLHERDFQVGLSILENIVSCMDRSRCIMLILSQRFLLSQWCQFEMHLAQHRLLETRREDLILILLEEIPRRLRPNTLHYLMLTKTYIVWPRNEAEQCQFWKRLKKSLVTHKLKHTENVSLA